MRVDTAAMRATLDDGDRSAAAPLERSFGTGTSLRDRRVPCLVQAAYRHLLDPTLILTATFVFAFGAQLLAALGPPAPEALWLEQRAAPVLSPLVRETLGLLIAGLTTLAVGCVWTRLGAVAALLVGVPLLVAQVDLPPAGLAILALMAILASVARPVRRDASTQHRPVQEAPPLARGSAPSRRQAA